MLTENAPAAVKARKSQKFAGKLGSLPPRAYRYLPMSIIRYAHESGLISKGFNRRSIIFRYGVLRAFEAELLAGSPPKC